MCKLSVRIGIMQLSLDADSDEVEKMQWNQGRSYTDGSDPRRLYVKMIKRWLESTGERGN